MRFRDTLRSERVLLRHGVPDPFVTLLEAHKSTAT